jgi:hypothetical protein
MTRDGAASSPLAAAALAFVGRGATVADIERRFSADGAELRPGAAQALMTELESLGLVRVARRAPVGHYVHTSLGRRLVDRGHWGDAAVPLKDLERMRTDFLSVIAHELRTPITVMRTLTGLMLDPASEPTDEQRRTMLETMERNAERMQDLVGDILDLARYRSGTISLQLRQFDASELAASAVSTIRPLAEGRGQTVELRVPRGRGPRVYGDRPASTAPCSTSSPTRSASPRTAATSRCGCNGQRTASCAGRSPMTAPASRGRTSSTCSSGFSSADAARRRRRKGSASDCRERSRSRRPTAGRSRSGAGSVTGARSASSSPPLDHRRRRDARPRRR